MKLGPRLFRSFSRISSVKEGCCECFKCCKCLGNGVGLVRCDSCGSFQPAPPTQAERTCCPDYYRLLLPKEPRPKFDVDVKSLREGYLALQSMVHPDRLGSMGESWTSWVNRAHATLKDPLQRAIYLLDRQKATTATAGVNDGEEVITDGEGGNVYDISTVLEIREEISMTKDPGRLESLKRENDQRIRECCEELKRLLDDENGDDRYLKAKRCINQLRYWKSIEKELKELL